MTNEMPRMRKVAAFRMGRAMAASRPIRSIVHSACRHVPVTYAPATGCAAHVTAAHMHGDAVGLIEQPGLRTTHGAVFGRRAGRAELRVNAV